MGILLGGLSALFFGAGDFLGGEGAKRVTAATIVLWAGVVSFPVITGLAMLLEGRAVREDLWLGAAAGVSGAFGLVTLFTGLGRGRASGVAPASAAVGAIIPLVFGVIGGERPTGLAWVGVAIAIPAIVLSSWVADPGQAPFGGFRFGVLAGVGFGGYAVIIDRTSEASGLLPLVPARAATIVAVLAIALVGSWRVGRFGETPTSIVAGNGVLDVAGNVALLLALRSGSLALVGVAASFYPAVTVLLARVVNAEQLRARQVAGVVLTLGALAAIAVG